MREEIPIAFILICILNFVESRDCTFFTSSGIYTITCRSYEFCCGNACCKYAPFRFYQFWYFWLCVILILLLCSGGSWWYKLRYRSQFYTSHYPESVFSDNQRHQPGVMYYTTVDRVIFQHPPKDLSGQMMAPPSYAQANPEGSTYQAQSSASMQTSNLTGPPPTYEAAVYDRTLLSPGNTAYPQNASYEAANSYPPHNAENVNVLGQHNSRPIGFVPGINRSDHT